MTVIEGAGPVEGKERVQHAKRRQVREEDQKELRAEQQNNATEKRGEANNQVDATA